MRFGIFFFLHFRLGTQTKQGGQGRQGIILLLTLFLDNHSAESMEVELVPCFLHPFPMQRQRSNAMQIDMSTKLPVHRSVVAIVARVFVTVMIAYY